jgi:hypothetical protein
MVQIWLTANSFLRLNLLGLQTKKQLAWFVAIAGILIIGFGVGLQDLNQPTVEIMDNKQTQIAEILRNLIIDLLNIFLPFLLFLKKT